jgi:hypothetical protein
VHVDLELGVVLLVTSLLDGADLLEERVLLEALLDLLLQPASSKHEAKPEVAEDQV